MVDAHLHLQAVHDGSPEAIWQRARAHGLEHGICCATSPSDWEAVESLNRRLDGLTPAYGIHPWWGADLPADWLSKLTERLQTHPRALVGEVGLDRAARRHPAGISLDQQTALLQAQFALAARFRRPVVLHVVRAWGAMMALLRQWRPHLTAVMIHGFSGAPDILRECLALNLWISLGPRLDTPRGREAARRLPGGALLIETDFPENQSGSDPSRMLAATHAKMARLRADPPGVLAARCQANARCFLDGKNPFP